MSDADLRSTLARVAEPILAELMRRGYRVRVEDADGVSKTPQFAFLRGAPEVAE